MSSSKRKGEGPPNKRATAQTTEVGYLAQIFAFGWAADGKLGKSHMVQTYRLASCIGSVCDKTVWIETVG